MSVVGGRFAITAPALRAAGFTVEASAGRSDACARLKRLNDYLRRLPSLLESFVTMSVVETSRTGACAWMELVDEAIAHTLKTGADDADADTGAANGV